MQTGCLQEEPFALLPHFAELVPIACLSLGCKMDEICDYTPEDLQVCKYNVAKGATQQWHNFPALKTFVILME